MTIDQVLRNGYLIGLVLAVVGLVASFPRRSGLGVFFSCATAFALAICVQTWWRWLHRLDFPGNYPLPVHFVVSAIQLAIWALGAYISAMITLAVRKRKRG